MVIFNLCYCGLLTTAFTQKTDLEQTNIEFIYEINRHGARAPITPIPNHDLSKEFGVEYGMLTPQGMRQRYLLGKYNHKRYTELN